jgi:hypothetical protein
MGGAMNAKAQAYLPWIGCLVAASVSTALPAMWLSIWMMR